LLEHDIARCKNKNTDHTNQRMVASAVVENPCDISIYRWTCQCLG